MISEKKLKKHITDREQWSEEAWQEVKDNTDQKRLEVLRDRGKRLNDYTEYNREYAKQLEYEDAIEDKKRELLRDYEGELND